jgi:hypothetical protein
MELNERLSKIQQELKAPKGQMNSFGGYRYRSCEDIVEAVKPLLNGLTLTISDEVLSFTDRFYVKATATISDGKNTIQTSAFAREPLERKGMDPSQITGATSSYARKYALNGMFAIDDTKDADTDEFVKRTDEDAKPKFTKPVVTPKPVSIPDAVKAEVETPKRGGFKAPVAPKAAVIQPKELSTVNEDEWS